MLFEKIKEKCPGLIKELLDDLLALDAYNDNEIAFATRVRLDYIRKAIAGNVSVIDENAFLSLMKLYSFVFCKKALSTME